METLTPNDRADAKDSAALTTKATADLIDGAEHAALVLAHHGDKPGIGETGPLCRSVGKGLEKQIERLNAGAFDEAVDKACHRAITLLWSLSDEAEAANQENVGSLLASAGGEMVDPLHVLTAAKKAAA